MDYWWPSTINSANDQANGLILTLFFCVRADEAETECFAWQKLGVQKFSVPKLI